MSARAACCQFSAISHRDTTKGPQVEARGQRVVGKSHGHEDGQNCSHVQPQFATKYSLRFCFQTQNLETSFGRKRKKGIGCVFHRSSVDPQRKAAGLPVPTRQQRLGARAKIFQRPHRQPISWLSRRHEPTGWPSKTGNKTLCKATNIQSTAQAYRAT